MKYSEPFVTNNLCNPNNNGLLTLFPCILFYSIKPIPIRAL